VTATEQAEQAVVGEAIRCRGLRVAGCGLRKLYGGVVAVVGGALGEHPAGLPLLRRREYRLAATDPAASAVGVESRPGAFADQIALELGQRGEDQRNTQLCS